VTVESISTQPYGDRPINIDMPYQADYEKAVGLADYVRAQYETLANQAHAVEFQPHRSDTMMLAAIGAQIGDRITISETVTGLALVDVFIQSIGITISPKLLLRCRFGLSPTTFFDAVWVMDDAALSLAGETTYFGYA
jgi:hypothetical protein